MEKKPTKRALQAQETKRKIYRCGAELFRKYGYQNVSVEQIAQAAGVGIGTLYHYYPSKADLYGEMFIRADDFFSAFEDAAALQKPPEEVLWGMPSCSEIQFMQESSSWCSRMYSNTCHSCAVREMPSVRGARLLKVRCTMFVWRTSAATSGR